MDDETLPEIAAVHDDRDEVLDRRAGLEAAIDKLRTSLRAARRAGVGANALARIASPALSRPNVLAAIREPQQGEADR